MLNRWGKSAPIRLARDTPRTADAGWGKNGCSRGTGELTTTGGAQPKARVSYVCHWHDALGRTVAIANYGTNGGIGVTRANTDPVPARSDTVLVTTTEYNSDGEAFKTIDPASKEHRREFDDAGRFTKSIANYVDGTPGSSDDDVTVSMSYTADGKTSTITAKNSVTGDQVTTYVYGTDKGGITPLVYRNDLLRAVIYPDSDDVASPLGNGTDGIYDRVEYKYNYQGEIIESKDQNGTIREYDYDKLGRRTQNRLTTVASGVDTAVRRVATTYEVRGLVEKVTNYDNATVGSGSVINEVVREYNSLGQLTKEYQEHQGVKDANTLYVERGYELIANAGELIKGGRLKSVRYPNGRLVHYTYGAGGSMADYLSRLDAIKDDSSGTPGATLASYTYLGLGQIVVEDFEEPDVKLDLFGGTSGTYAGLDNFGRVVDQLWRDYGASADRERFQYGYDRAGNRTYRDHVGTSGRDEFYTYDGVQRLKNFDRGNLINGNTAIDTPVAREQDWTLDPLGNWGSFAVKTSGTTDLAQSRTHNKVNEITDITESTGTAWVTPAQDLNGNLTTVPKPSNLANGLTLKYDGWNRLVEVNDNTTVVGKYEYDGLNRRVKKHLDSQSPASPNGVDRYEHYFYNDQWQLLEMRDTTTVSDQPENLAVDQQFVWSARYIDALILRDRDADGNGGLEQRHYFLNDANMNVTCLVDTNGDAVERYQYDPYGVLTFLAGDFTSRSASSYAVCNTYTGREYDPETGLYGYRHRTYDPNLGRFTSRDPIGYGGSPWNLYEYVNGMSIVAFDPLGLQNGGSPAIALGEAAAAGNIDLVIFLIQTMPTGSFTTQYMITMLALAAATWSSQLGEIAYINQASTLQAPSTQGWCGHLVPGTKLWCDCLIKAVATIQAITPPTMSTSYISANDPKYTYFKKVNAQDAFSKSKAGDLLKVKQLYKSSCVSICLPWTWSWWQF